MLEEIAENQAETPKSGDKMCDFPDGKTRLFRRTSDVNSVADWERHFKRVPFKINPDGAHYEMLALSNSNSSWLDGDLPTDGTVLVDTEPKAVNVDLIQAADLYNQKRRNRKNFDSDSDSEVELNKIGAKTQEYILPTPTKPAAQVSTVENSTPIESTNKRKRYSDAPSNESGFSWSSGDDSTAQWKTQVFEHLEDLQTFVRDYKPNCVCGGALKDNSATTEGTSADQHGNRSNEDNGRRGYQRRGSRRGQRGGRGGRGRYFNYESENKSQRQTSALGGLINGVDQRSKWIRDLFDQNERK